MKEIINLIKFSLMKMNYNLKYRFQKFVFLLELNLKFNTPMVINIYYLKSIS